MPLENCENHGFVKGIKCNTLFNKQVRLEGYLATVVKDPESSSSPGVRFEMLAEAIDDSRDEFYRELRKLGCSLEEETIVNNIMALKDTDGS